MLTDLLAKVGAPAKEYRCAPFWAWNGKLEPEELRRQICEFKKMGLGGFFMHARVGLNTEYLGKEWFDCVRACIDEAKKNGLNAWLYDEDRWPSGAAGGLVTRDHRYRAHYVRMLTGDELNDPAICNAETEDLGWFVLRGAEKGKCESYRKIDSPKAPLKTGEMLAHFIVNVARDDSWFNDQAYLDTLNVEAVDEFIRVTHEAYRREIGDEFGTQVPGIFTDEPNFRHGGEGRSMPWTGKLAEKFAELSGFALTDRLPELFYLVGSEEFSETRLHYYDAITRLFVNAFSRRIGEWCDKNKMQFTGHVLGEDNVLSQTGVVGSAMRFYEYMQSPGIDLLTEHWNIFLTAKQCVSMAHQFGRKSRLSETYGCTGWDFPLMGHKALGDWQLALGINLFCPHLAWYTMEAEAKRDYPASISYQSPWCDRYGAVTAYQGGVAAALSEGEEVRDLLVIHPIESTWGVYPDGRGGFEPEWEHCESDALVHLTNTLLGMHLDFDFGEEEVMSRHAKVEAGRLQINLAKYRAVLLPEMRTIRATTLALLAAFQAAGGFVAYMGEAPRYVDGKRSAKAEQVYGAFCPVAEADFDAVLSPVARHLSIRNPKTGLELDPVLYIEHDGGEFHTLFCCNTAQHFADDQMNMPLVRDRHLAFPKAEICWKLPAGLNLYEVDPATGKRTKKVTEYIDGAYRISCSFAALESHLYLATAEKVTAEPEMTDCTAIHVTISAGVEFPIVRSEPNVLVLDMPSAKVNGGEWRAPAPVLKLDDDLRTELGKRPRCGMMVQPWLRVKAQPERTLDLTLGYEFDCSVLPEGDCELALERPDLYRITLNGKALSNKDNGFWVDRSLRCIAVPRALIQAGRNRLELACCYHEGLPGLEYCYLLGVFGVYGKDVLGAVPTVLTRGDWCEQGLPYYSGNVTYRIPLAEGTPEGAVLELGAWRGAAMLVSVNGAAPILAAYPPFEVKLTGLTGKNDGVEVTLLGHRRNSHGPFYLKTKWPNWTGPGEFKRYELAERQLVPTGLL